MTAPTAVTIPTTIVPRCRNPPDKPGKVVRESGNVDAAFKSAAKTIEAEYYIPHIAHATMEPPCAVARIIAGKVEVWAPTQAPQVTREDVAKHLGYPCGKCHGARDAARRRIRTQIEAGLSPSRPRCCRRPWTGARSK